MPADGDPTVERHLIDERYSLIAKIGQGGFGTVYRARDTLLQREVAVKVLHSVSATQRDRFLREARAMARLHHPNIVDIYDAGEDEQQLYLVLELIDGRPLSDGVPIERAHAKAIIREVTEALAAAHDAGIVHRDIKPANILIDRNGHARVTDFGIARLAEDPTITGNVIGTPAYMAPEQLEGRTAGAEADLYALGRVMSDIGLGDEPIVGRLADRDPKKRGSARDVLEALERGQRPSIATLAMIATAVITVIVGTLVFLRPRPSMTARAVVHLRVGRANDILDLVQPIVPFQSRRGFVRSKVDWDTRTGELAGIPVTVRRGQLSEHEVEIQTSPDKLDAAREAVGIVDALSGSHFKTQPSLFTGSVPSARRISSTKLVANGKFLSLIAEAARWPLVQDSSVDQVPRPPVAATLNDVPWDEAVHNVVDTLGLALWRDGDIWILESQQRRAERERTAERNWVAFAIQRSDKNSVAASLRHLLSESGALEISPTSGVLIVCDTPERVDAIGSAAWAIDPAPGRDKPPHPSAARFDGEPISLDVRNVEIVDLLTTISRFTKRSMVIDPSVRGRVSVTLPRVAWDNIFDAVLVSQGVAYELRGTVRDIFPESKVFAGPRIERTIHLRREKPTFFSAFAKAMATQHEEIVLADDNSGTLILRGVPRVVEKTARVIQNIDSMK